MDKIKSNKNENYTEKLFVFYKSSANSRNRIEHISPAAEANVYDRYLSQFKHFAQKVKKKIYM